MQPAKMCASQLLRHLLGYEIQHIFCLSPADYSTILQDPVPCGPVPFGLHSALTCELGLKHSPLSLTIRDLV
jgi:hypothetical protein